MSSAGKPRDRRWQIFDEYAGDYDQWFETHHEEYDEEIELLRGMIPPWKKGVEIGVGTGRSSVPLGVPLGLEPSPEMGRIAKRRGIEVIRGVAEQLPFCGRSFDLVLMVTVIFLLQDVKTAFTEVFRILEPGGHFVLAFIECEGKLGQEYWKKPSLFMQNARFYSLDEVQAMLDAAGFRAYCADALRNGFFVITARKKG